MVNQCYYCFSTEHNDTIGITSVDPKHENKWFCSTSCLCTHKQSGQRAKKKRIKHRDNEKNGDRF